MKPLYILSTGILCSLVALTACDRKSGDPTPDTSSELAEQTSPKVSNGEGTSDAKQGEERIEILYTAWTTSEDSLDEMREFCEVEPLAQFAKPAACWSSTRGWLIADDYCVDKKREVFTSDGTSLEVGGEVKACVHSGDVVEGLSLTGPSIDPYFAFLSTSKAALPEAANLCAVTEFEDADAETLFADLRFDEAITADIEKRYAAKKGTPPECFAGIAGKSLPKLLAADKIRTNDAFMTAQLDEDEEREMLLPLHFGDCEALMLMKKDGGAWGVAIFADPVAQVGDEGWSYYFATDKCTDLDGDGIAEIWLPNGGETERAYHLYTTVGGAMREIGTPLYAGD